MAEKAREEQVNRIRQQASTVTGTGPASSTGRDAQDAAPSRNYAGMIVRSIRPNIIYPESAPENLAAVVEVRAAPDGTVLSRRLLKTSGNGAWDEAVLRAIDRTGKLPRDTDGRVPPRMEITFRPRD